MTLLPEPLTEGQADGKAVLTLMGADSQPHRRRPRIQVRPEITLPANDRVRPVGVASHTCRPGPDALGSRANSHEDAWVRPGGSVPGRVGMPMEPLGMPKHTQLLGDSRSQRRAAMGGLEARPGTKSQ